MTTARSRGCLPGNINPGTIGLFLDVDGTLLDIAPHPGAVEVKNGLRSDLAAADRALGGALALVSGRPIAQLDELFAPLRLAAGGIHGAELRLRPEGPIVPLVPGQLDDDAWCELCGLLSEFPGSYAENKKVSFAVHYPEATTDSDKIERALLRLIERIAVPSRQLQLIAGHAVFEIQLHGFDKGRAIERFMADAPFRGRQPVFIADDEIDRAGFERVLALGGLIYSVGFETQGASGTFADPEEVRAWLHELGR